MNGEFQLGPWLVSPKLNSISCNGTALHVEPKVMDVLVCLAQHAGEPVSKDAIIQTVWHGTFVTDDVLKRCVSELRRVFDDDAHQPHIIQTISKRGYRLIAPVTAVNNGKTGDHSAGAKGYEADGSIDALAVPPTNTANAGPGVS